MSIIKAMATVAKKVHRGTTPNELPPPEMKNVYRSQGLNSDGTSPTDTPKVKPIGEFKRYDINLTGRKTKAKESLAEIEIEGIGDWSAVLTVPAQRLSDRDVNKVIRALKLLDDPEAVDNQDRNKPAPLQAVEDKAKAKEVAEANGTINEALQRSDMLVKCAFYPEPDRITPDGKNVPMIAWSGITHSECELDVYFPTKYLHERFPHVVQAFTRLS